MPAASRQALIWRPTAATTAAPDSSSDRPPSRARPLRRPRVPYRPHPRSSVPHFRRACRSCSTPRRPRQSPRTAGTALDKAGQSPYVSGCRLFTVASEATLSDVNQEITRTEHSAPDPAVHRAALPHPPGRPARPPARHGASGHWGLPSESAAHIVAELAANATVHGRVPGRDFRLSLAVHREALLRIEVTDTRGERVPPAPRPPICRATAESGRGLLIVEALADRWGVDVGPAPRKTVWAETRPRTVTAATGSRGPATRWAATRLPTTS